MVDPTGIVTRVELARASDPAFVAPAIGYVKQLVFEPARLDDRPVAHRITYTVSFIHPSREE